MSFCAILKSCYSCIYTPVPWAAKMTYSWENLPYGHFRFNEDELRRFYIAANGDFSSLLSSVKKTIRWRETFHILTLHELEKWSHLVFWHGFDTMLRPCLIVRLGLACSSLAPSDRPRFGQAVGNFSACSIHPFIYVLDCLHVIVFIIFELGRNI